MITGGIKFYEENLIDINSSFSASSGSNSVSFVADNNYITAWRSVGSDDTTTETITIDFPAATSVSRLHFSGINWKSFQVKYNSTEDFTYVISLDSSTPSTGISETTFDKNTAYYEFDAVSVNSIDITIDTTQTADEEKYLRNLSIVNEIGTLQGYPTIEGLSLKGQRINNVVLGNKVIGDRQPDTFSFSLVLSNYPTNETYQNDLDILDTLSQRDEPFFAWLCGGRFGASYFRHTVKGFRLEDFKKVQIINESGMNYNRNIYINGVNASFTFQESVK